MQSKQWFTVVAVFGFLFGLAYLILPGTTVAFFGLEPTPAVELVARFFGGTTLAWGLLAWWVRAEESRGAVRPAAAALAVGFGLGALLSGWGAASGLLNGAAWVAALLFLAFGVLMLLLSRRG